MKKILLLIFVLTISSFTYATPVMVFLKDGKIDLFDSNEIERIETDNINALTGEEASTFYQHFLLKDSRMEYSVAEIDSVCFGYRNIIKSQPNVRRISVDDLDFIIGYDGKTIIYSNATGYDRLPSKGEKIFHDTFCDVFPYGLCAIVESVEQTSTATMVNVAEVDPSEIFEEYLISGDFELSVPAEALLKVGIRGMDEVESIDFALDYNEGAFKVRPMGSVNINFRNLVASPVRNYYHADIYISYDFDLDFEFNAPENQVMNLESPGLTIFRTLIAGVISPKLDLKAFLDAAAECRINFNMHRGIENHYEWTKTKEDNIFNLLNNTEEPKDINEAKLEVVLEGSIHLGLLADLSLNTLFDKMGVGIKAKLGPHIEGSFGFGIINDLTKDYSVEAFHNAFITTSLLAKLETYAYYHDWSANYTLIKLPFELESRMFEHTLNLLPEMRTMAVRRNILANPAVPSASNPVLEAASNSNTPIIKDLEIGFQVIKEDTNEVVDEIFNDNHYLDNLTDYQGFVENFNISDIPMENLKIYPVVKYGKDILKLRPSDITNENLLSGIFYSGNSNGTYIVGGSPVIDYVSKDSTLIMTGNIIPVSNIRPGFKKKRTFHTIGIIETSETNAPSATSPSIFGNWKGECEGNEINMTLNKDFTCSYDSWVGSFDLNNPQAGMIKLNFGDDGTLILVVEELEATSMTIRFGDSDTIVVFYR